MSLFYESMSRRKTPTHLIASSFWHQPRVLCTTEPTAGCLREAAPAVKTVALPLVAELNSQHLCLSYGGSSSFLWLDAPSAFLADDPLLDHGSI
jgi:hypothetical protein